jgi:hypothetical protein
MSDLKDTVTAMNAAFVAHGINNSLLHEFLTDAVESAEAVLQSTKRVMPMDKRLRLRAKVNTGKIVINLIEHQDFLDRFYGEET